MNMTKRFGVLLLAVCAFAAVVVPTGPAALKPVGLTITGFAAEVAPADIRPSYWPDDRYITAGTATWTTQPNAIYYFCLKNITAPYLTYDREGCIGAPNGSFTWTLNPSYSWTFDPEAFPNNIGGIDSGFRSGETIGFYVKSYVFTRTGSKNSAESNIVYETIP
jgi:hypothetical protein